MKTRKSFSSLKHGAAMLAGLLAAAAPAVGTFALQAATVNYVGPGADLADPANWSGTWTSEDTLVISTNTASFPEGGFTLSQDLSASAKIQMTRFPAAAVKVECGGRSLNTAVLDCGNLHGTGAEKSIPVVLSGGFSGVGKIENSVDNSCIYLTNGTFEAANGFKLNLWYQSLHILKGAELVVSDVNGDVSCCVGWNASLGVFDIDGGRLRIAGRSANNDDSLKNWRRIGWLGASANPAVLKIRNGGEYVDDTESPSDFIVRTSVLIDGGAYIATNAAAKAARNTCWVPPDSRFSFAVTNGTLKVAQFGTGDSGITGLNGGSGISEYSGAIGTRISFHNSQEIFGKKSVATTSWEGRRLNSADGMVFARKSKLNTLVVSGSENVYRSGWFVLGGQTNMVEVAGGSFSVTNRFCAYDGDGSLVRFTGGASTIESMHVTGGATNFTVEVSGDASVNISELTLARETKFRFVVPEDGFAAAPIQCGATGLGGNLKFEFDTSGYTWPTARPAIPLIRDDSGFAGWGEGGAALDVGALNAEYADVLPDAAKGRNCAFRLVDNGRTLCLYAHNGFVITFR